MTGSATIVISESPVVNITGLADSYCQNASPVTLAGTASPAGGSFTIDANPATIFDPSLLSATTHTVVYTYTDPVYTSCTGSDSKMVTIEVPIFTQAASVSTSGAICAGLNLPLSFGVNCPTNSTFTAELSDASGNFGAAVSLGSVSPGNNSVTIPAGTPTGTGYKIRVVGTNPALTSVSGAFSVTGLAGNFNSTPTVSQTPACAGANIKVSFTVKTTPCSFPSGNTFSAQLSNAAGSFASPINLGTVTPGVNTVTVPETIPTGSGYRVRVVYNAAPTVLISPVSSTFSVNQPAFSGSVSVSLDNKCPGEAVRVSFGITACAFFSGNGFTVELSNSSGNFSAATTLPGAVTPGLNQVVIPVGTPAGTGYKLRIKSSNPALTSAVSSAFKVKACNSREAAPEEGGLQVSVSPNPSPEGKLRIAIRGAEGQRLNVALFNGTGQPVREQAVGRAAEEEVLEWEIARHPQGLYLLRVSGEKETKTVKVLH
ncbi:MAG: T9SS type A sorting domain-containing protein [Sphingobacteriaceae bacterium]|nr:T9SS type A sorting domain-containing protein [Cytophagaceae bacterium]